MKEKESGTGKDMQKKMDEEWNRLKKQEEMKRKEDVEIEIVMERKKKMLWSVREI